MARNTETKRPANSWYYFLPGIAAPIGGGLIKIGQSSTIAAVGVALAPYMIMAALYAIFMIGYVPAVICYLCSGPDRQNAINHLIATSANAIVALLTLTPTNTRLSRTPYANEPRLCAIKGGSDETSEQGA